MIWLKRIYKLISRRNAEAAIEWHENLSDLPFLTFEKCFVHKSYHELVKAGKYTLAHETIAIEKWYNLYSQFCEATDDKTAKAFVRINCKIMVLQATIERAAILLEIVRSTRSKAMEKMLAKEFKGVPFDVKDEESYQKALNLCGSRIKSLVFKLNEFIAERDAMTPKEHRSITEQYFTDILLECSNIEGYRIAKKDITALEFCGYFKRLVAHRESLEKRK